METSKPTPITVDPTGGEILSVAGGNYRVLVSGKQTNGAFSTIEMLVPPQNGPRSTFPCQFLRVLLYCRG